MSIDQFLVFIFIILGFDAHGQMPNTLTPAEKVFGLSRFWQEVNYNFVYLEKVNLKAWDSTYLDLIAKVQKTENDYSYFRLMKKFCATLKDGHTNIDYPKSIESKLMRTMFGEYRFFVKNIAHKAIITHINASKKDLIPPGSEILKVNGYTVQEYMDRFVSPYISSSTAYVLEDNATEELLKGLEGESYDLLLKKPNGQLLNLSVEHAKTTETELFPPLISHDLLEAKWLDDHIFYLALNSFDSPAIDSIFISKLPELYQAKSLILDLRNNGGGNSNYGLEILKYLIPNQEVYGAKSRTRNHIATYKAWGEMVTPSDTIDEPDYQKAYLNYIGQFYFSFPHNPIKLDVNFKRVLVPTAILIGHGTASAAEDFLIYAEGQSHFTTIGQPTFGSTGQPYYFRLPGNAQARVCTKHDFYPSGKEFVGVGIQPDILIEQSVSDYIEGNDVLLNQAIDLLNGKN